MNNDASKYLTRRLITALAALPLFLLLFLGGVHHTHAASQGVAHPEAFAADKAVKKFTAEVGYKVICMDGECRYTSTTAVGFAVTTRDAEIKAEAKARAESSSRGERVVEGSFSFSITWGN